MENTIQIIDTIDNSNTLYENVLKKMYSGDLLNTILISTKFLRLGILNTIKGFIESEKSIYIKEFSHVPAMIYDDPTQFNYSIDELKTDAIIVKEAFNLSKVIEADNEISKKYSFVLEALHTNNVTKESWDDYLDKIYTIFGDGYNPRVQKIVIEDVVTTLKNWSDHTNEYTTQMIKKYNKTYKIKYNINTFWQEPLYIISQKYWNKFSFVLTINDYDLYDESKVELLNLIADKYFNNGYFDEIVIKINYFYWHDNFDKIVNWSMKNLRSALVSYRFNTIFTNTEKNRYYDDDEASKCGDIQRKNTIDEELIMFNTQLPIFLKKITTNPQTYGFELEDGYFGKEGDVTDLNFNSNEEFETYKEITCKMLTMSPFINTNDRIVKIFRDPLKKIWVCLKK